MANLNHAHYHPHRHDVTKRTFKPHYGIAVSVKCQNPKCSIMVDRRVDTLSSMDRILKNRGWTKINFAKPDDDNLPDAHNFTSFSGICCPACQEAVQRHMGEYTESKRKKI